jgi:GDP-L-fucose synthase
MVHDTPDLFRDRRVLVAGGTGLIGRPLVEMLIERGAKVRVVSLDHPSRAHAEADFRRLDLLSFRNCLDACDGMEFVFNLLGVKGSPAMASTRPASYLVPTLTLDTNLMEAARQCGAERFLFTSSIGVYAPAPVFHEDDVWQRFPSRNDWFPAWGKRMGELQAEAYRIEFGWDKIAIIRPANVYGPHDNFSLDNAMVIPSLIRRLVLGENPVRVWGDGAARRDFVHARDVARGALLAMEQLPTQPINLGSGVGVSIGELVDTMLQFIDPKPTITWDTSKPTGDPFRVLDIARARSLGYEPTIALAAGIEETIGWFRANRHVADQRYDVFLPGGSARLLA